MPLSKTEWTSLITGAISVVLIIIFSVFHSQDSTGVKGNAYKLRGRCITAECMEAAAWLMGNMDESIDPCESLYDRTCGYFADQHPFKVYGTETSVLSNMREKNLKRIQEIISSAPVRSQWGEMYETAKMVNNFYKACIDQYQRTTTYSNLNTSPIQILLKQLGTSWWVNDPNRLNDFYWQEAMRTTALEQNFVFFTLQPLPKAGDITKNVLEIAPDQSQTFNWQNQLFSSKTKTNAFKAFLVLLGRLMARDHGTNTTNPAVQDRITQFADDVVNVTARLSRPIIFSKLFGSRFGQYRKTLSYGKFKAQLGNNFVDWDSLIDSYTKSKLKMKNESRIVENMFVGSFSYSSAVSQILRDFSRNDRDFRRKMNNYFAFRIALYWLGELNYEYNHLYQSYLAHVQGETEYPDDWEICLNQVDTAMPKTLGALYVAKFYRRDEEKTVNEISEMVRKSLLDEVATKLTWMDEATKEVALDKLSNVKFKIGKPASWVNGNAMANELATLYGSVYISPDNHFENVRALAQVQREEIIRQLTKGSNAFDHWRVELYETHIDYYARWNELLIPAGILQEPIVSPNYPGYMNFGGLGSWIASELLKAIDEDGQVYNASYTKANWWSPQTWDIYNPMKQSVIEFYNDSLVPPDLKLHLNVTAYAPMAIAETGGLRQAYKAYKRYLSGKRLTEKALPSLAHGNVEQMFFYSYASTHCADYTSHTYIWRIIYGGIMPEFIHVDGAVALMDEFRNAFQCRPGSKLVMPETKKVPFIF